MNSPKADLNRSKNIPKLNGIPEREEKHVSEILMLLILILVRGSRKHSRWKPSMVIISQKSFNHLHDNAWNGHLTLIWHQIWASLDLNMRKEADYISAQKEPTDWLQLPKADGMQGNVSPPSPLHRCLVPRLPSAWPPKVKVHAEFPYMLLCDGLFHSQHQFQRKTKSTSPGQWAGETIPVQCGGGERAVLLYHWTTGRGVVTFRAGQHLSPCWWEWLSVLG